MILKGIHFPKGQKVKGYGYTSDPFYRSREWRKFRQQYLTESPLCVMCERDGRTAEAKYLDHITPIKKGGAIWDKRNLQGLCVTHNAMKTSLDNPNNDFKY